jgi:hypothetical protein
VSIVCVCVCVTRQKRREGPCIELFEASGKRQSCRRIAVLQMCLTHSLMTVKPRGRSSSTATTAALDMYCTHRSIHGSKKERAWSRFYMFAGTPSLREKPSTQGQDKRHQRRQVIITIPTWTPRTVRNNHMRCDGQRHSRPWSNEEWAYWPIRRGSSGITVRGGWGRGFLGRL